MERKFLELLQYNVNVKARYAWACSVAVATARVVSQAR